MRLTRKLLGYLNRVFNKDPKAFLAIQIHYAGGLTWKVQDGVLTTTVVGGPGASLTVDLSQYTIGSLTSFLAAQPGYSTPYSDVSANASLSALVLLDNAGDASQHNGDLLWAYSSLLWAYMEANAAELRTLHAVAKSLPSQMSTTTAQDYWLDVLGGYYNVPRLQGETDASFGPRIIATVLRPASNNVALEAAIQAYTGQAATVTDVTLRGANPPLYNANAKHDGSILHNAVNNPLYGLFDVTYGYDLVNGADLAMFRSIVEGLIERLRAAGTHMRSISLTGSVLTETLTPPTDGGALAFAIGAAWAETLTAPSDTASVMPVTMSKFTDALTAPSDVASETITYNTKYNGVRSHNGVASYNSGKSATESL